MSLMARHRFCVRYVQCQVLLIANEEGTDELCGDQALRKRFRVADNDAVQYRLFKSRFLGSSHWKA